MDAETKKENTELIEDIKMELGWPIVDIEISDDNFNKILDKTMRQLQPYILFTQFKTLPNSKVIDLPEDVVYVMSIFRGEPKQSAIPSANNLTDDEIMFGATAHNKMLWDTGSVTGGGGSNLSSYYLMKLYYNTLRGNTANVDFVQNGNKLYVESAMDGSTVTIEYVPKLVSAKQITDPYWSQKLYYLFLANSKIIIGRARSKYIIQSAKYNLDGTAILEEGLQEKQQIMDELEQASLQIFQVLE